MEPNGKDAYACSGRGCDQPAVWTTSAFLDGVTFEFPVCRQHGQRVARINGVRELPTGSSAGYEQAERS